MKWPYSALDLRRAWIGGLLALLPVAGVAAQATVPSAEKPSAEKDDGKPSQEELDQMLASIALYPDELLSQVLMACTYPLEIVEADRWTKEHKDLKGDALAKELEKTDWDPSVKSLVNFPEVLASLSENLDWTQKIGDAFLADQEAVMDTVQSLRAKAKEAGHLESTDELTVKIEPAPAGSTTQQTIIIESPDPEVIYVPAYNPTVVYGPWWYPAYPPPTYYRPPYYRPGGFLTFGIGFTFGVAWGYAWGGCNWRGRNVDIDIDRNVNINANINRSQYKAEFNQNRGSSVPWQHDPSHRKGVSYADRSTAQRFEGRSRADAAQARESFRGRADADRAQLARDRAQGKIDSSGRARPSTGGDRPSIDRDRVSGARTGSGRDGSRSSRDISRPNTRKDGGSGAFTGAGRSSGVNRSAARGRVSRAGGRRRR
ncbi:MAG: DUF3300 domain-containing protein [Planctomycetota bacterium]